MGQQIRFCTTEDGVHIAYAVSGKGPPLVMCSTWLTHLEQQWNTLAWQPWLRALAGQNRLVRYDPRGCGLSDRDVPHMSFEDWVRDFEAVVASARLSTFALLGVCQGGPVALEYAARHPERVTRLVLYGTYARGRLKRAGHPEEAAKGKAWMDLAELGWGQENHEFLHVYSAAFQPGGTLQHLRSWGELQRASTSAATARRLMEITFNVDVTESARRVRCPTLVVNPTRSRVVPLDEARRLAALIPNARFIPLESENHMPLAEEPAWHRLTEALNDFLGHCETAERIMAPLTTREQQILRRIAEGLDNAQIAAHLGLSEKTVRNNVTSIFAKLRVENRLQAIVRAREAGVGVGDALG